MIDFKINQINKTGIFYASVEVAIGTSAINSMSGNDIIVNVLSLCPSHSAMR